MMLQGPVTPSLLACLPKAADQMLESWALGTS